MTYLNTAVATAPGPPPIDLNLPHLETPLAEYDVVCLQVSQIIIYSGLTLTSSISELRTSCQSP